MVNPLSPFGQSPFNALGAQANDPFLQALSAELQSGDPARVGFALQFLQSLELAAIEQWLSMQSREALEALLPVLEANRAGRRPGFSGGSGYSRAAGGGGGGGGGGGAAPTSTSGSPSIAPAQSTTSAAPGSPFGPGKKVLMLGDSHTVGTYGQEMSRLIGGTGSSVKTDAKVGVSPSYFNSRVGDLIRRDNPDTIVISLGANMRGASQAQVNKQIKDLEAQIRAAGSNAQIVWVGPPRTAQDMRDGGASINQFNQMMRNAIGSGGRYVDSAPFTNYSGPDGIHYNADPARRWAAGVFGAIQGT
jgi:lysophospholipase L1-like esterase